MTPQERLLQGFCDLVRIHSPSGAEDHMVSVLKKTLQDLGCTDISEDTAGAAFGGTSHNLYAFFPGNAPQTAHIPTLMFSAHMDCVPPCENIEPHIENGVITSKGDTILSADDKSGIIAILEGLRRIKEQGITHGSLQIIFTVCEEKGIKGSRHMDKSKIKADFGYVLDCGGAPGTIVYGAPGISEFTIKITGKAAHAGLAPETGLNAIMVAAKALSTFPQGRKDAQTTANVGTITGGTATNIVADYAQVVCEARSLDPVALQAISAEIAQCFNNAAQEYGAHIHIDLQDNYDSFLLDTHSPVMQLAQQAALRAGLQVRLETSGGGSDANNFNAYGLPTVPLGTGMSKVHTTEEYITVQHLEQSCALVMALIQEAATSAHNVKDI